MTSAIMNPLHVEDMQAILGADVVMGHDRQLRRLDPQVPRAAAEGAAARARSRREGRRRAREQRRRAQRRKDRRRWRPT